VNNLHRITKDDNSRHNQIQTASRGRLSCHSEEVPGLTVEFDTRDEIIATAPEIARELLEIEAGHPLPQRPVITFAFD
jgi:hypothetical protein